MNGELESYVTVSLRVMLNGELKGYMSVIGELESYVLVNSELEGAGVRCPQRLLYLMVSSRVNVWGTIAPPSNPTTHPTSE